MTECRGRDRCYAALCKTGHTVPGTCSKHGAVGTLKGMAPMLVTMATDLNPDEVEVGPGDHVSIAVCKLVALSPLACFGK